MNLRTALHLGLMTSLGSLMVLWVSQLTEEARTENRRDALRSSLMELLQADDTVLPDLELGRLQKPTAVCDPQGVLQATIIPGSGSGYSGQIEFVMAVNRLGTVTGVRVTAHSETPGIGDVIEVSKSDWIHGLGQRDARQTSWQRIQDGGDIDGVSGATISVRGLLRGIGESVPHTLEECAE